MKEQNDTDVIFNEMPYDEKDLYVSAQEIIKSDKGGNLSYTDIYDFSAAKRELTQIAYICDGHDECSMQPGCIMRADPLYASDWVCNHTLDPMHAKTALCNNPECFPERFARYDGEDGVIRYFEKEPTDEI